MVTMVVPMCLICTHVRHDVKGVPQCAAFPKRILRHIIDRQRRLHILPLRGDHGIQFEMMSDEEQCDAFGEVLGLPAEHRQTLNRYAPIQS